MNSEENKKSIFEILKDEPLESSEMDRFEYSDIADGLTAVIQNAKAPFTIGLYGRWGCGKTSICKLIEKKLEQDKGFKTFYFDIWKYENDSFRRQFLIELDEKIFGGKFKYREKLNQSLTTPKTLSLGENIKIIWDEILIKALILFSTITIILFSVKIIFPYIINYQFLDLLAKIIDLGLLLNFFNFILSSVKLYQGSIHIDKTDSAEGFEYYYKELLKKLCNKKLLVIIDNLDRVPSEKVAGILSDIKTFLAKDDDTNNAVFIIPCDNEALSHHLCVVYHEKFDVDEFLRKFFNLTFKIPKLLDIELDDYISMKLLETKITEFENNFSLSFVITLAFRDNPREIIQFINSLICSFLVAQKRELSEVLSNIPFLAKVLVIRQKWPISYAEIENKILRTGIDLDGAVRNLSNTENKEDVDKIIAFLDMVPAKTNNYDIFFSLHESKQEKECIDFNSFILSATEKRFADVELIYEKIKNNNNIAEFIRLLNNYINKNKDNRDVILNIFISIVKILSTDRGKRIEDFQGFFSNIFNILKDSNIYIELVNGADFANLLNNDAINSIQEDFYGIFIQNICTSLSYEDGNGKPSINIYKGIELFDLLGLNSIWKEIKDSNNSLLTAKSKFINAIDVGEIVVNKNTLDNVVNFILNERPMSNQTILVSITKINEIISHNSIGENAWKILNNLRLFIEKIIKRGYVFDSSLQQFHDLSNTIISKYNSLQHWSEKGGLIKLVFSLSNIKENSSKEHLSNLIVDFISKIENPCENIYSNISSKTMIRIIEDNIKYKNAIINRTKYSSDVFVKYKLEHIFNEQEMDNIVHALVSNQGEFLNLLEYLNFNLSENTLEWLPKTMIDAINMVPLSLFERWINAIGALRISSSMLIEAFRVNLLQAKQREGGFNDIIIDFCSKNKKLFEGIIDELIK